MKVDESAVKAFCPAWKHVKKPDAKPGLVVYTKIRVPAILTRAPYVTTMVVAWWSSTSTVRNGAMERGIGHIGGKVGGGDFLCEIFDGPDLRHNPSGSYCSKNETANSVDDPGGIST